jgi:peptide chain release factor 2
MKAIESKFQEIRKNLDESLSKVGFDGSKKKVAELSHTVQDPTLWEDKENAKRQLEALSKLQQKLEPWQHLDAEVTEIGELIKLGDKSLESEIDSQLDKAAKNLEKLSKELAFSGPYDGHNAVLNIHAGAGGTDAQDWASMLLRMYLRWAEKSGVKTKIIEESPGEEAGLKSVSLAIKGPNVYGKLKGEHGVHRLVRLSPFNANNLRQTSFAKVEVMPEIDQPGEVPIEDKDLKIDVYRAGGHGGQSVNTTDSAVRVTHVPTGISVAIQNERSQIQNKETAMTILRSKLAQLQIEQHAEKISQLKGPNQSAEWGSQIRNYVLHPYNMVKDLRTKHETGNTDAVLDGGLDGFIEAYLQAN